MSQIKEAIKTLVELGGTYKISYKSDVKDWYGDIKIFKYKEDYGDELTMYCVDYGKRFINIDDAVNYFCDLALTSKNVGYVQSRLSYKMKFDEYDIEDESPDFMEAMKKEAELVDAEAKLIGIEPVVLPTAEEGLAELTKILEIKDQPEFEIQMIEFRKKYLPLDLYIHTNYTTSLTVKMEGMDHLFYDLKF